VRHAIPHEYDTIDGRKMQEENERLSDKILTMCADLGNGEKMLAGGNSGRMREMVELLRLYHFSGFLFAILSGLVQCHTGMYMVTFITRFRPERKYTASA